jgi:MSHA biogenesis protein MshK
VFDETRARKSAPCVAISLLLAVAAVAAEPPLRDPMQPFEPAAATAASGSPQAPYRLSAVLISASRRIAVLNGRPYRQGDRIDGVEIARIEPGAVHLRRGDEQLVVRLRPQSVPENNAGRVERDLGEGEPAP